MCPDFDLAGSLSSSVVPTVDAQGSSATRAIAASDSWKAGSAQMEGRTIACDTFWANLGSGGSVADVEATALLRSLELSAGSSSWLLPTAWVSEEVVLIIGFAARSISIKRRRCAASRGNCVPCNHFATSPSFNP